MQRDCPTRAVLQPSTDGGMARECTKKVKWQESAQNQEGPVLNICLLSSTHSGSAMFIYIRNPTQDKK
uniref:Uncharacterized protein n=1 Tax=Caenorhabditis japonica TaxID=281687 RepID=A0A8R1EN90_CAEJA